MNFETLEFEVKDNIGILSISRPNALNALNAKVINELGLFFESLDATVQCLILTGSGEKAFVAGADIKEMASIEKNAGEAFAKRGQTVFQLIENSPIPVIAAVNGFALGGGLELAMACDFIIASQNAKFGLPEVSLGLIPGLGGTQRLSRYIGKAKARLMVTTGDIYSAQKAYDWGLVAEVVEAEELKEKCLEMAASITKRSPLAVRLAKKSVTDGFELSQDDGMQLEAQLFGEAFASEDKVEGVNAFIEKRKPNFTGK
ncbi:enoyl-CoA hydratase-related protein [Gammaproteobacteria bacterium]|nr:enoyl-CoA hydratase-related protein [Gammaproteobacteria bacterium]